MCGWVVRGCRSGGDQPVPPEGGSALACMEKIVSKSNDTSKRGHGTKDQGTLALKDELHDGQLEQISGGIIAVLVGRLDAPAKEPAPAKHWFNDPGCVKT